MPRTSSARNQGSSFVAARMAIVFSPIWRTIAAGVYQSFDAVKVAFKSLGCNITEQAETILQQVIFVFSSKSLEFDLVVLSVAELGFAKNASLEDIYARGIERGLELCPVEIALLLRLQYRNQPRGEDAEIRVAMHAVRDLAGHLFILTLKNGDGGPCLDIFSGHPKSLHYPYRKFVFVCPRK